MSATSDDFGASQHLGEDAELYALGALERDERERIDAHAATCAACARALAAAMATVAALDDAAIEPVAPPAALGRRIAASARAANPSLTRRAAWPLPSVLTTAASVALAIGIGAGALVEHGRDTREAARQSAIVATLADAHFLHVSLTPRAAGVPASKAIYGRDGAWLYVVIDAATCACRVVVRTATGERDLGPPDTRGTTATLFTRDAVHPTSVALVDDAGRIRADAQLAYP
jgi:hypothetical protein